MVFIFGGAYQGKTDFAKEAFSLAEGDISSCSGAEINFICRDMFCGVVPMGAETRAWRQDTGRLTQYLSREAEHVSRIFCGLEQRLK